MAGAFVFGKAKGRIVLAGNGRGGYDERKTREVWDMVGSVEELKKLLVMAQNKTAAQKKFRLWKGWNKNEI